LVSIENFTHLLCLARTSYVMQSLSVTDLGYGL
jgi:hypothetical protein